MWAHLSARSLDSSGLSAGRLPSRCIVDTPFKPMPHLRPRPALYRGPEVIESNDPAFRIAPLTTVYKRGIPGYVVIKCPAGPQNAVYWRDGGARTNCQHVGNLCGWPKGKVRNKWQPVSLFPGRTRHDRDHGSGAPRPLAVVTLALDGVDGPGTVWILDGLEVTIVGPSGARSPRRGAASPSPPPRSAMRPVSMWLVPVWGLCCSGTSPTVWPAPAFPGHPGALPDRHGPDCDVTGRLDVLHLPLLDRHGDRRGVLGHQFAIDELIPARVGAPSTFWSTAPIGSGPRREPQPPSCS